MVCHIYLFSISSETSDGQSQSSWTQKLGIIWDGKDFGGHLVQPFAQSRAQLDLGFVHQVLSISQDRTEVCSESSFHKH